MASRQRLARLEKMLNCHMNQCPECGQSAEPGVSIALPRTDPSQPLGKHCPKCGRHRGVWFYQVDERSDESLDSGSHPPPAPYYDD